MCPTCNLRHDKKHNIINYDNQHYICSIHNNSYTFYCKSCNKNICIFCEKEHNEHEIISFGKEVEDIEKSKSINKKLREVLDIFKKNIEDIKNILDQIINKLEKYYNIAENIINNYDSRQLNYETIYNIKQFNKNEIVNILKDINKEKNFQFKWDKIYNIYDQLNYKDIIYLGDGEDNKDIINLSDGGDNKDIINLKNSNKNDLITCKFMYNGMDMIINSSKSEKMDCVFDKFKNKVDGHEKSFIFLFNGNIINSDIMLEELLKENNVFTNTIQILVLAEGDDNDPDICFIKQKFIICPQCTECCKIKIVDYKIMLYGCKKGQVTDNILFDEYESTQIIDMSKIKCSNCNVSKAETYNNLFYSCIICQKIDAHYAKTSIVSFMIIIQMI